MARTAQADPLEKFRFIITWTVGNGSEGTTLQRAGFHDMQMPKRSTNVINYREGSDPDINQKAPGLSTMEDVVMGRGLIAYADSDAGREFYRWMSAVHNPTAGHVGRDSSALKSRPAGAASNTYRKDVTIQQLDREGAVVKQWTCQQAWPSNFVPGSDLDASEDGDKSIEQLTLAYEDFKEEVPDSTNAASASPNVS